MISHTTKSYSNIVALVGGGTNPMPGEISLADNGVLFLDEIVDMPILVTHLSEAIGYHALDRTTN